MNIGIYIYDEAEVLDFSGPFEVFSTANRLGEHNNIFNVFLISENGSQVTARAGFRVLSDYSLSNHPPLDVLIIAGGVHNNEMYKLDVCQWINNQAKQCALIAAVCTGAFLLAQAEVITDHSVTTHWQDIDDLKTQFPSLNVLKNVRWVDEEKIITSGGISAGIDMSLHIVSRLQNNELAEKTAKQMEFQWTKNENF